MTADKLEELNKLDVWDSGRVRRWHTHPHIAPQNVADHSWGVVAILYLICAHPSRVLIKAAVFHDIAEIHTGDVPSGAKWAFPELKKVSDDCEKVVQDKFNLVPELEEDEMRLLKWADLMELALYCHHESMLGNTFARQTAGYVIRNILARTVPNLMAKDLLDHHFEGVYYGER